MVHRIKALDVDLGDGPAPISGLTGYRTVHAIARLHGVPIGRVDLTPVGDQLTAGELRATIVAHLARPLAHHRLGDLLEAPAPASGWGRDDLTHASHPRSDGQTPLVGVAVCTSDRSTELSPCLDALMRFAIPLSLPVL